jgi:RNA polymerase sigma-70 factor (ECF subfamily)
MAVTRASLLLRVRDPANAAAWTEFDSIYRPLLQRYAKLCGLSDADAEDVVQHCMVAVHKHITSFEYDPSKGRFKGWLRTLVNNKVRNLARNRREHQAATGAFAGLQATEPSPEEAFDELWMQEHIRHALQHVRSEIEASSFEAYQRYVIEDQPVDEVCESLGINRNQLYGIKWRVNQKLNAKMTELLEEGEPQT